MKTQSFVVKGQLVDILNKEIYTAEIEVEHGKIAQVKKTEQDSSLPYIIPGFIDSHVHVESSMLVPSEFARMAVVHGTVASVNDPHEIANVCGMEGVKFMIENSKTVPFKFNFGAPSCVPATTFETAGDCIDSTQIASLLQMEEIKYLAEMMNFPGVLHGDEEVMKKIAAAKAFNKPVDGHAPGLSGEQAKQYIDAGISTDHECFTAEEALDKLKYGMKILIREGSAAKNFEALIGLLNDYPNEIMFCSDDKHPDSLEAGHINQLCARAVAKGIDVFKVLQAACINPVKHYKLDVGLLQQGDNADFIVVKDLCQFVTLYTYISGELVAGNGMSLIKSVPVIPINKFNCEKITIASLAVPFNSEKTIPVIEALDGQLITNKLSLEPLVIDSKIVSDTHRDILKLVVINRYNPSPIAIAWIKNFGLKHGAIASTVAHDSHNIIAVGVDDESLQRAINLVIQEKGGLSCVSIQEEKVLPLPVAGLMTDKDGYEVSKNYTAIDQMTKSLGSTLSAPYMTLSFMALLVIPHLKLSDKGLFDGDSFDLLNQSVAAYLEKQDAVLEPV